MKNREELQKKADDKLLGRLQDEKAFADELAKDPELAEVLADTELAMAAIAAAEDEALKARLQKLEVQLQRNQQSSPLKVVRNEAASGKVVPLKSSFLRRNMAAIAAGFALAVAAAIFLLMPAESPSSAELFAANFEPYPNIAVDLTRGSEPSPEEIAFTAYENGDYLQAVDMIEALTDQPANRFYLAQAQLAQNEYTAAQKLLLPLASQVDFPLAQEANWYLALADLGLERNTEATQRLTSIVATEDHPFREKARALLESLGH